MKASVRLKDTDDLSAEMAFTMTIREWKELRRDLRQLKDVSAPTRALSQTVAELVARTEQTILGQEPEAESTDMRPIEQADVRSLPPEDVRQLAESPAPVTAPRRRPAAQAGVQA
jgi:hypothetical protein